MYCSFLRRGENPARAASALTDLCRKTAGLHRLRPDQRSQALLIYQYTTKLPETGENFMNSFVNFYKNPAHR